MGWSAPSSAPTHTCRPPTSRSSPGGTAFLCDGGFTGPHESVIGREIEPIIRRFLTNMPQKFEVAKERVRLQGAVVEIDELTGHAKSIQRVSEAL